MYRFKVVPKNLNLRVMGRVQEHFRADVIYQILVSYLRYTVYFLLHQSHWLGYYLMGVKVPGVLREFIDVYPFVDKADLVPLLLSEVVEIGEAGFLPGVEDVTVPNEVSHFQEALLFLSHFEGLGNWSS